MIMKLITVGLLLKYKNEKKNKIWYCEIYFSVSFLNEYLKKLDLWCDEHFVFVYIYDN